MKLIYKILLGYFLVVSVLGTFSTSVLIYNIQKNSKNLDAYREREITSLAKVINLFIPNKESLKDLDSIQKLFLSTKSKLPHIKRLTLHAKDEKTLKYIHIASSLTSIIGVESHQEDINAILNNSTTILYEDTEDVDRYLDITYPILNESLEPIAALGIAVSLKESDEILKKSIDKMKEDAINIIIIAIAVSIILAILLTIIISKKVIYPIEKLTAAVKSVSKYKLKEEIDISSNDELGELANEFNKMTLELHSLYSSMEDEITLKTKELEKHFLIDTLTGLNNRFALVRDLKNGFYVAILDISSFKDINDLYGIEVGNKVLKELSNKCKSYLIHTDLKLYRLSGDEIAIANPHAISKEEFSTIVERIIKKIEHETFYFEEDDIEINISIHAGISYDNEHAIEKAHIALVKAKNSHSDYVIYNNQQHKNTEKSNHIEMISKIKFALHNFGIIVYYQKIVDKNHNTIKYEALVRMKDNDKILSPYFFLDVAKKTKYYQEITKSVIYNSLKEFANRDELISINICAEDIVNTQTQDFIKEQLSQFKTPSNVVFELVESEDIHSLPELSDFILHIKKMGAKIAIDDFGTGYSNFVYLMDLEPDYLKIDGSLIKNIDTNKRSYDIVKTIVTFANGLNIKVIAEFVHSKEVLKICEELNIDEFQGYYFHEPSKLT